MDYLENIFEKCCINAHPVRVMQSGAYKNSLYTYKRPDFCAWAAEAYKRGEQFFFCRPVDPNDPYGEQELCDPEYRYFLKDKNGLSEEEYKQLKAFVQKGEG